MLFLELTEELSEKKGDIRVTKKYCYPHVQIQNRSQISYIGDSKVG